MPVEDAIKYVISTGIVTAPEAITAATTEPVKTI
jgi:uncharacterized membrane protein